MKYNTIYFTIFIAIILLFLISNFSFKDGKPTCNNFVINTYLYLAFSICFLGIIIHYFHKYFLNSEKQYSKLIKLILPYFLLLFIVSLVLIYYISIQPTFDKNSTNVINNHIMWLIFISIMSIILIPRVKSSDSEKYVNESIFIVSFIFITMSSIVYLFPSFFSQTFNFMYIALLLSLITIIIAELINYFFNSNFNSFMETRRIISYIVIFIFSLYVSYDTQKTIMLSNICSNYPNYPKTSVSFFLDLINLFSRVMFLKSNR